ncbi:hypothetical protein QBC38DRAFT_504093 [Podospora fimiseda]|uniref:Uncharacterized protein n=1 Tax=Podospora fimiseda TaxID=252190 RepID=A0AAN7BGP4_9PEZI|nr:hypothetical protein QBC38DRAFT_504093 [Podospora fimiseda]
MFLFFFLLFLLPLSTLAIPSPLLYNSSDINTACGLTNPDCPSPLTCIPLSKNCTTWTTRYHPGCPGTCQYIDYSSTQKYTMCGGWAYADDCYESKEVCIADPRTKNCGISCDGKGLCHPYRELCGWNTGLTCPEGKVCFGDGSDEDDGLMYDGATGGWVKRKFCVYVTFPNGKKGTKCGGVCLPLRYGSDTYEKSLEEEVWRTDQDGWNGGVRGERLWELDGEDGMDGGGEKV